MHNPESPKVSVHTFRPLLWSKIPTAIPLGIPGLTPPLPGFQGWTRQQPDSGCGLYLKAVWLPATKDFGSFNGVLRSSFPFSALFFFVPCIRCMITQHYLSDLLDNRCYFKIKILLVCVLTL